MELIWTNQSILDLKEFRNYTRMSNPNVYISNLIKKDNKIFIVAVIHHRQNIQEKYRYIKKYFDNNN